MPLQLAGGGARADGRLPWGDDDDDAASALMSAGSSSWCIVGGLAGRGRSRPGGGSELPLDPAGLHSFAPAVHGTFGAPHFSQAVGGVTAADRFCFLPPVIPAGKTVDPAPGARRPGLTTPRAGPPRARRMAAND